jgi:hypothetical protein
MLSESVLKEILLFGAHYVNYIITQLGGPFIFEQISVLVEPVMV